MVVSVGIALGLVVSVFTGPIVTVACAVTVAASPGELKVADKVSRGIGIVGLQALRITPMDKKMVMYHFSFI
jgi:hypothetical protein